MRNKIKQTNWWCKKCGWFPEKETWKGPFPTRYVKHDCKKPPNYPRIIEEEELDLDYLDLFLNIDPEQGR